MRLLHRSPAFSRSFRSPTLGPFLIPVQDRRLLSDIAVLAASVIKRWIQAHHRVTPIILGGFAQKLHLPLIYTDNTDQNQGFA